MKDLTSFYGNPERERVFEFVDPATFTRPAYVETGLTALETDLDTSKFVLYAVQLAIAVHRPQEVRDLEDASLEDDLVEDDVIPEDTVAIGDLNMPTSMVDQLSDSFAWFDDMPVIEDDTPMEERPRWYKDTSGRIHLNSPGVAAEIAALQKEPEPYHPHKGYYLSHELDHLAAAIVGAPGMIQNWDEGFASKRATPDYRSRYDAFFTPDFYLRIAEADLKLDMAKYGEQRCLIGHRALSMVLEQYGPGTRQRLAREIPRQLKEDAKIAEQFTIRTLDPEELRGEPIDFDNIRPEDFL